MYLQCTLTLYAQALRTQTLILHFVIGQGEEAQEGVAVSARILYAMWQASYLKRSFFGTGGFECWRNVKVDAAANERNGESRETE
jgi:hypothetical protein